MKHTTSLFIFRQDFRIHDNNWLLKAISESKNIIPIFIFDENILSRFPKQNKVIWFLINILKQLEKDLLEKWSYLSVHYGDATKIIPELVKKHSIDAIYRNESYWYNTVTRDVIVQNWCKENTIAYYSVHDYLIVPIDAVPVRKVFTPFYKLWQKYLEANSALTQVSPTPTKIDSPTIDLTPRSQIEPHLGGDTAPLWSANFPQNRLKQFDFTQYDEKRNIPSLDWTSKLSPYIRFGVISSREIYQKALEQWAHTYISELAWREFWQHIYYHFPHTRTQEFQEKRKNIMRNNDKKHFEAWKNGMTGYPMVDAWMRQLKAENRMHGRNRMVVASFLTKDLLIDRRWWEKYFAELLIDYDTNVNIGNRQWSASVWADPKPLRIFSPMLQSERFDPDCTYIKKWIPELEKYSPKQIHNPLENNLWYATPIVNHYEWSKRAKELYKESSNEYMSQKLF
jgi:deoxyribodipyrimidine photo-lyase